MLGPVHLVPSLPPRQFVCGVNRNVAPEIAMAGRGGGAGPEAYHGAVERALEGLTPFREAIDDSLRLQGPLLEDIFAENER